MIGVAPGNSQVVNVMLVKAACVMALVILLGLLPNIAHAQGNIYSGPRGEQPSYSMAIAAITGDCPADPGAVVASCDCYPGLANRIVGCIRQTLHNASEVYFDPDDGIHGIVSKAISAMMILGVAIYGVMLSAGMVEKLGRDTFTLLLKIAFVSYFVINTQELYNIFLIMIDALASEVFQFSSSGLGTSPNGLLNVCMDRATIWERMDCMIDSVIGIQISTITSPDFKGFNDKITGDMLQRGLIGTFFQMMKSSSFGIVIGLMGFFFIYSMLFFLVRVLFAFLMSFISLTFLMMLGPIFIPMIIFRVTKQYFDKWVRLVIASCLQPILLVAFITFAIAGLDLVMFTGPTAVVRVIAGNKIDEPNFNLQAYINQYLDNSAISGPSVKGEASDQDFRQTVGTVKGIVEATSTKCLGNTIGNVTSSLNPGAVASAKPQQGINSLLDCTRTQVKQLPYKAVDLARLAAFRDPPVIDQAASDRYKFALISVGTAPDDQASVAEFREASRVLMQRITQELFASVAVAVMMMLLLQTLMKVVPMISTDLTGEFRYTPNFMGGKSGGLDTKLSGQVSQNMKSLVSGRN